MRTAVEISRDIAALREWLRGFGYFNVAGKGPMELAELEAKRMGVERRLAILEKERAAYIATPLEGHHGAS